MIAITTNNSIRVNPGPKFFTQNPYHKIVNPVRNSSRCDSKPSGALNPALRGGTPYGAEPGIILKSNPAAAAGPGSAQEGLLPRREGLWPGGGSGHYF
jgi:hypothetical protein